MLESKLEQAQSATGQGLVSSSSEKPHNLSDYDSTTNSVNSVTPVDVSSSTLAPVRDVSDGIEVIIEGPTSLSAHSTMAIGFLDRVAGADSQRGCHDMETQELLDGLKQIVQAIKTQHTYASTSHEPGPKDNCRIAIRQPSDQNPDGCSMPPIQASVAAIRKAQGEQSNANDCRLLIIRY